MEKNRLQKVRKHVFYKHTNIVTKKWGERTREIIFPETHEYLEKKRWKEIDWKKCENKFFYKHTNVVTIKCEKNARTNLFQKHEYRDQKTMEKNCLEKVRNTFFINTRIS